MDCSKMFNVSTIGYTTHIKPIVQFLPNASQHYIVNGCNSFCYSCLQLIHVSRNRGHIGQPFHKSPQKEIVWCKIWRSRMVLDLDKPKAQITEAVATIDNAMLGRVWQELDYRLDVCRVSNGAHVEHLWTIHVKIEITSFLNLPDAFLYP